MLEIKYNILTETETWLLNRQEDKASGLAGTREFCITIRGIGICHEHLNGTHKMLPEAIREGIVSKACISSLCF